MGIKDKAPADEPKKEVVADEAPKSDGLFTLPQLAQRNGQAHVFSAKDHRFQSLEKHDSPYKAEHLVADVRHGWRLSESRTHQPVRLSDADYLAAIAASKEGKTHEPANKRDPAKAAKGGN